MPYVISSAISLFLLCVGTLLPVFSQPDCPQLEGKRIRWIVPYSAGGGYDVYSRLIKPFLEKETGAAIRIENLPGAGGILGAKTLKEAAPDGLTLGYLNVGGLLAASLTGLSEAPNPATDFTILGQVARPLRVLFTRGSSELNTMSDVLALGRRRPVVAAISEIGGTAFLNLYLTLRELEIPVELISGLAGSRQIALAVMRGEVDLADSAFESVLDLIEAGELKPLLQVSAEPISEHPSLQGVMWFAGEDGLAVRRARERGKDADQARLDAAAIIALVSSSRMVAGPPGMDPGLERCLADQVHRALTNPEFHAAAARARRSLTIASAEVARAQIKAAVERLDRFIPVIREHIRKVRGQ